MTTTWEQFSKDISNAVEQAGKSIVAVDGRAGHTSSGIVWRRDSILTAAHAIRHESKIGVIFGPGQTATGQAPSQKKNRPPMKLKPPTSAITATKPVPDSERCGVMIAEKSVGSGQGSLSSWFCAVMLHQI